MTLTDLCNDAYEISASKGWHDQSHDPTVRLMLVVCELAEAVEEFRKGISPEDGWLGEGNKPEGPAYEIADCFIRLADFCKEYNIEITSVVRRKLDFNKTRPLMHGGRKF